MTCRWCKGRGYLYVERGSSLSYTCTDCNGSGIEREEIECEGCGEMVMEDEECEKCETCEWCGELMESKCESCET